MLKIWGYRESYNCQKVFWCVGELGLGYEFLPKCGSHGGNDDPDYRRLNPNGRSPTIEDDGFVLWESNVIVSYLAQKHDLGGLAPADLQARADAERWMTWQTTTIGPEMKDLVIQMFRTAPEKRDQAKVARQVTTAGALWGVVEDRLDGRDYLMGERFTMADIPLGGYVQRWFAMDIERPRLPRVEAWFNRLLARPAFLEHVHNIPPRGK